MLNWCQSSWHSAISFITPTVIKTDSCRLDKQTESHLLQRDIPPNICVSLFKAEPINIFESLKNQMTTISNLNRVAYSDEPTMNYLWPLSSMESFSLFQLIVSVSLSQLYCFNSLSPFSSTCRQLFSPTVHYLPSWVKANSWFLDQNFIPAEQSALQAHQKKN